jgi:DnaK suppressor protein
MTNQEVLLSLTEQKSQLEHRMQAIEADFHKGRSQDFSKQATETENDDVLDEIHNEAKAKLKQVIEALHHLKDNKHGFCSHCNSAISPERLQALPYINTCIKCAQ